ncbi:hypothetical protein [Acinetobacter sp. NIPH 298]|uniref:hypothetical protein n=1 Tax=Acinetobacter sp. NIPH 298 TaxID=1217692 RepID=UPI0002CEF646|nr:hypothetical protein [Acinetobacter sp. NIPH 298]ENW93404.1 hypothetical protein F903_02821 [Acinetobacter sp. NIPH 298]
MKLIKTLLATTLTLAAATTFAASANEAQTEDRVVVSTQEQPATDATSEAAPASEPVAN